MSELEFETQLFADAFGGRVVTRPETTFDGASHTYKIEGEDVLGVSTVAKIGEDETWAIASAWGFRIGYEGVWDLLWEREGIHAVGNWENKNDLRAHLQRKGLTPWSTRDRAAERGTWVHDVLERLGQNGTIPDLTDFDEGVRGYVRAVLAWFVDYRPEFVATEVQVASETHGFAGRYDIRCLIDGVKVGLKQPDNPTWCVGCSPDPHGPDEDVCCGCRNGEVLSLVDLKTSKGIYPTTHFPQLAGYEIASVEMGFPPTAAQFVLNAKADGTYEFKRSWSVAEDFIAYLGAERAKRRIKSQDPEEILKRAREDALLSALADGAAYARDLAARVPEVSGLDARAVARLLGGLQRHGVSRATNGLWSRRP